MTKINWKIVAATLTSSLTVLAALPYQLGDIATIIPPNWKSKVVVAGLVATTILRIVNTKITLPQPPPNPTPPTENIQTTTIETPKP